MSRNNVHCEQISGPHYLNTSSDRCKGRFKAAQDSEFDELAGCKDCHQYLEVVILEKGIL